MPGDVQENTPSEVQKINETETSILLLDRCFLVNFRFFLVTRNIHLQYFAGPAIASGWPTNRFSHPFADLEYREKTVVVLVHSILLLQTDDSKIRLSVVPLIQC